MDSGTAKFGDALRNQRDITQKITDKNKNVQITVNGRLAGDSITFESIR
jgi:hypothetical protein